MADYLRAFQVLWSWLMENKMETYQDLELKAIERKIEYDSIIMQIENIETELLTMQLKVLSLKEFLKGSVYFEQEEV